MSARVGAIEYLPELDRTLVEERNKALYSADIPPELSDLSSWLDEQTHNRNYPSAPPGSRLNDSRYGPTVQFLFPQNRKSSQPFEAAANAMGRWANSRARASQEHPDLEPRVIREFAEASKTLIRTGDPREPFATPDRKVRLHVNDFPDEPLWTLYRQGRRSLQFDDWPKPWQRPSMPGPKPRGKNDRIWYYAMAQYQENHASELRIQDRLSKWAELATDTFPLSLAGLALRRWHWRIENRRQSIEELDGPVRELLAQRTEFVRGGPFPDQTEIVRFQLSDNNYEHFFGISWGNISPVPIRWIKGIVEREEIESGPTIGYFFAKADETGGGEAATIELLQQWAETEPPSYQEFLRQTASAPPGHGMTPGLEYWFEEELRWKQTSDFKSFYKTQAKGSDGRRSKLSVRINDFPDERMFSLLENGAWIGDFNDWPQSWKLREVEIAEVSRERAVRVLKKAGFKVVWQTREIGMYRNQQTIVIPPPNPIKPYTLARIAREAGLTSGEFRRLL